MHQALSTKHSAPGTLHQALTTTVSESVLEYVLDGLEAALELERELGVRTVEIDRALLKADATPTSGTGRAGATRAEERQARQSPQVSPVPLVVDSPPSPCQQPPTDPQPSASQPSVSNNQTIKQSNNFLAFLHDRPLSAKGVEMMAKIIKAMGRTAETAPIVVAPPVPHAKIVVVLGGRALKKYFPEMRGEPGDWRKTPEGADVLITYTPEYILRFATVTPAVQKIKQDMWRSLKAVVQRLG